MAGALVTTNILSTTASMGLATLREHLALVMIANRDYEGQLVAAKKNATVNIAVPAAVATRAVSPDVVPPSLTAVTPTSVPITLDTWREAPFAMDDKGLTQVDNGILPMQASEAVKALANYMEDYLWAKYPKAYGYAGTAGTTPFAVDASAYLEARKVGNRNLMAADPRYMVIDVEAEANALGLRGFQDASFGGGQSVILDGMIGRKLGALWVMSQRVPSHTAGTITTGLAAKAATVVAAGATSFVATTAASTGACALLAGDVIAIAGHTTTYALSANATQASANTDVTLTISNSAGLERALAGGEAITVKATHRLNSLIHRDALAFASAPLIDTVVVPGATLTSVAIDEASGLSLRLEVTRQHRQVQWSFDALFGGAVVRDGSWVRLAG